jgi:hypothetical protein
MLVTNFLPKLRLEPCVWMITEGRKTLIPPIRLRFADNSLARILKKVVLNTLYGDQCEIDNIHAREVHRIIFEDVRKPAFEKEMEFSTVVQQSREAFKRLLIPPRLWIELNAMRLEIQNLKQQLHKEKDNNPLNTPP